MGRAIPENQPLSDEDRAFLLERSQDALVATIDRVVAAQGNEDADNEEPQDADDDNEIVEVDADISDFAEKLTIPKLEKRILALHEEDPESVELPGSDARKDDYVSIYSIALQEKRNKGEELDLVDDE